MRTKLINGERIGFSSCLRGLRIPGGREKRRTKNTVLLHTPQQNKQKAQRAIRERVGIQIEGVGTAAAIAAAATVDSPSQQFGGAIAASNLLPVKGCASLRRPTLRELRLLGLTCCSTVGVGVRRFDGSC
ncbi:hypothetical protein GWI33_021607 [Rhynchophorus ferrugineus]|uniref:Uncharacterized protein n=1 Tax=Rhynchophorus ferrugineus TaxID=354439 RepID=A0A834ITG7_RHYFE|nr:hypothetical protein GWI33_021607 [Rhynchophorus ferrugineus]